MRGGGECGRGCRTPAWTGGPELRAACGSRSHGHRPLSPSLDERSVFRGGALERLPLLLRQVLKVLGGGPAYPLNDCLALPGDEPAEAFCSQITDDRCFDVRGDAHRVGVTSRLVAVMLERQTVRYAHVGDQEVEAAAERVGRIINDMMNGVTPATRL